MFKTPVPRFTKPVVVPSEVFTCEMIESALEIVEPIEDIQDPFEAINNIFNEELVQVEESEVFGYICGRK
jgi:hypothetical protein